MKRFLVTFALCVSLAGGLTLASAHTRAQEPTAPAAPAPAAKSADARLLLKDARTKAAKEKKAVLVVFHASWCGWCKKLDGFLEATEVKPILAENYEIVHLDVMESPAKKSLENPHGNDVLKELGGAKSGLPFYAVLNAKGEKIGDSNALPGDNNIGYPAAPEEIAAFEGLLKKTAPRLDDAKRARLVAWLKRNAPKPR